MHMTTWLVIFLVVTILRHSQPRTDRDNYAEIHQHLSMETMLQIIKKCSIIIDNVVINISCAFLAYNYGHTLGIEQSIKSAVRLLSYREGRMLGNLSAIW